MHQFFVDKKDIDGKKLRISGANFKHISYSLRLKKGDRFVVNTVDTKDNHERIVEILNIFDDYLLCEVVEKIENKREASLKITLAQAVAKNKNMEFVVEKGTEIGINDFIPLETKRTVVRLKNKKEKRRARWQRIAEAAAKQSRRGQIPLLGEVSSLENLENISGDYDLILVPWEEENKNNLRMVLNKDLKGRNNIEKVLIIIGPEGGFAVEEIDFLKGLGARAVTLGPRILRTETAGLVTAAVVLYESGDMEGVE